MQKSRGNTRAVTVFSRSMGVSGFSTAGQVLKSVYTAVRSSLKQPQDVFFAVLLYDQWRDAAGTALTKILAKP